MFVASTFAFAQRNPKFVQPTKPNVGIYKSETRRDHYLVRTNDGQEGWIEKRLVATASGKSFLFDDAEVIGYLDNPTPVYIIDADSKDATPIKLDRSFAEALKENIDRETVERQRK
jgi:hypothetical protein